MRQIEEQNARVQQAKCKQKDFYLKYLRRNNDEQTSVPLTTSLEDFKKARFANSKIGAGVNKLNPPMPQINQVKPLLNKEDLAFLNRHDEDDDFPFRQDSQRSGKGSAVQLPDLNHTKF